MSNGFRLADLQKQYLEHSRLAAGYSRTGDARLAAELAVCKQINDEMKQCLKEQKGACTPW